MTKLHTPFASSTRVIALSTALVAIAIGGCSSASSDRTEEPGVREAPPSTTPTATTTPASTTPSASTANALPRAQAVQQAEMFVRNQGYTELAPLFPTPIQRESLEDGDEAAMRAARHATLGARSVGARQEGNGWIVLFALADFDPAEPAEATGRAVRLRYDSSTTTSAPTWHAEMVHQGALLPSTPTAVTLVGRLRALSGPAADCGTMHFVVVARYEVVRVLSGAYDGDEIMVIHGCPELARAQYGATAGSLQQFDVGAAHRMVLVPDIPEITGGAAIIDSGERPDLHRYWAERTDLAPDAPHAPHAP